MFRWRPLVFVAAFAAFVPQCTSKKTATQPQHLVPAWQSIVSYVLDTNDTTTPSSSVISLFGNDGPEWTLSSTDGVYTNLSATVPGDAITDLLHNELIGDPYFGNNLWNATQRRVWMGDAAVPSATGMEQRTRTWTYTTQVDLPGTPHSSYLLVLESIKMGAHVAWNGQHLATVTNQFLRYRIPILPSMHTNNTLTLSFDPTIPTEGRFMAASGGWDWAPYANVVSDGSSRAWTFGIVGPIYLVSTGVDVATITDVVPLVRFTGPYARTRLPDRIDGGFVVTTTVRLDDAASTSTLRVSHQEEEYGIQVRCDCFDRVAFLPLQVNSTEYTIEMPTNCVDLWWPRGYGAQPLSTVEVSMAVRRRNTTIPIGPGIQRHIAFRTLAQVTTNDTDDAVLQDMLQNNTADGSGEHGMFFRINGVPIHSRGANVIPMDQLEGRLSVSAAVQMVHSAADANMNMLRVWGGGSIPPVEFYDACDALGLLVYQDLMFVEEQHHGAKATPLVQAEIEHIVRTLAYHPSIVLWNGCNECGYAGKSMDVYATFVMKVVASVDTTRPIWPSSPSKFGWASGVDRLTGMPNGQPLQLKKQKRGHVLEDHGPYQRSFSVDYPAVNGHSAWNSNETLLPPIFDKDAALRYGPAFPNTFTSEFGASVFSSFESMSSTLSQTAWGLHGGSANDECVHVHGNENACSGSNVMAQRNYPCDNRIRLYFGDRVDLDTVGEKSFRVQLYLCMIAQLFWIKGRVEIMRTHNSFGMLIWQLNENWPTGGWGCVEYGPRKGKQAYEMGGRWKPIMYLLKRSLFQDVTLSCGEDDLCFVVNDGPSARSITVNVTAWNLTESAPTSNFVQTLELQSGQISLFSLPDHFRKGADVGLTHLEDGESALDEAFLWNTPRDFQWGHDSTVLISIRLVPRPSENKQGTIVMNIKSDQLVLYVWLSTTVQGMFSDNAIHLRPNEPKSIAFTSVPGDDSPIDILRLRETLRVCHLGTYHEQQNANLRWITEESTKGSMVSFV